MMEKSFVKWAPGSQTKVHHYRELLPSFRRSTDGQCIPQKRRREFYAMATFCMGHCSQLYAHAWWSFGAEISYIIANMGLWLTQTYHDYEFSKCLSTMSGFVGSIWSVDNIAQLVTDDICKSWWRHQIATFFRASGPLLGESTGYRWIPHKG